MMNFISHMKEMLHCKYCVKPHPQFHNKCYPKKKTCAEFLDKNLFRGEVQGHLGEHFHLRENLQGLFLYHQWTCVSAGGLITR